MAVPDDFRLIREIRDAGGRKQVFDPRDQRRYEDLVTLGWLKRSPPLETKSAYYQITDRGRSAATRS